MTKGQQPGGAKKKRKETAEIRHSCEKRKNMPSVENALVMNELDLGPATYIGEEPRKMPKSSESREPAFDPQLVWRGKATHRLEVATPPLFVQERVSPKTLIDDIKLHSDSLPGAADQALMFQDFNGLPPDADRMEFYQHRGHWSNRMILGDSLQAMASLVQREKMRGGGYSAFSSTLPTESTSSRTSRSARTRCAQTS